ncbi:anti-sigma factor [Erwinia sp. MMLR14_017]|uniref:anti-sigma factor n=1 Tax=Erwinia sp. MMLR14_017 TaxID=3093842 RepID=UPI00298F4681|nr:anti-sigma factor [Erwinia sp. MMLR14_017]MDW8844760.1 anti-sigma factor [Erwinia sp. MMLR14_017]
MKTGNHVDSALAAEYALGTLRGPARQHFERRLQQDRALQEEVSRWQTQLGHMDTSLKPVTPPAEVWQKILRSLPVEQRVRMPFRWHYLGWALAACFAGALLVNIYQQPASLQAIAVLNSSGSQHGSWVVAFDRAKSELTLQAVNTGTLADRQSFELWLIPPGQKPQSLGVVNPASVTRISVDKTRLNVLPLLAISLEPKGGSPTGQPTGPVVFSGKVAQS